jgi:hypothetical protein
MRSRLSFLLAGVAMLAASAASAGTLTNATWFQVTQGIPMTRTFGQLGATGTSGSMSAGWIAVSLSYPQFTSDFFVPKTANGTLDLAIHITQGGPQSITATNSMANGTPGIPGTVVVMTAAHIAMGANQTMYKVGINTLVKVPLSAGKAGIFTGTFTVVGALHKITVDFYAWTPHTLTFTGLTTKGVGLPTVTAQGSFNISHGIPTPNASQIPLSVTLTGPNGGAGTVTLVSPSKISIDGSLAQRRTASFTKLVMSFVGGTWVVHGTMVPEPATLLLLGAGALGLVLMGSRKKS